MCGIAGIWDWGGGTVDPERIATMTHLLHHRGPDDFGFAFFGQHGRCSGQGRDLALLPSHPALALGHRRLSIIDLAETGHQPMSCAGGRYWITYNGEIYNYIELRRELQNLGHHFIGASDTEVVLKSFEQWGHACVDRFNGMWAFAIWDSAKQTLFCSRDRFGIKPFYYASDQNRFTFASEIKSVLAGLSSDRHELHRAYLARFIMHGLLNDGEETLFQNVKQLLPAHCLELRAGRMRIWRYWDIPQDAVARADRCDMNLDEAAEQFRDLLADAVRLRFRADVPVGVNLSGGLDSSAVTSLASSIFENQIRTFTVAYDEPEYSEGDYARQVAEACRTEAYTVTPTPDQYLDFIERFSWIHDEPCVGSGMFSQWHVLQLASRHVKVSLDGQGADELLGGYTHYYNYYLTSLFKRIFSSGPGQSPFSRYLNDLRAIARHTQTPLSQSLLTAVKHLVHRRTPAALKKGVRSLFSQAQGLGDLVLRDWLKYDFPVCREREGKYADDLNEILYWELTRDNLPMLLQNGDRISMAFSVESRLPFLDYRVVEFASALPYNHKINGATTKVLLRRALRNDLPSPVINRGDKKGFPTPFGLWLKGPLRDYANDTITSRSFRERGIFSPDSALKILEQHGSGQADHSWLIWRLLNLETWLGLYVDDFQQSAAHYCSFKPEPISI